MLVDMSSFESTSRDYDEEPETEDERFERILQDYILERFKGLEASAQDRLSRYLGLGGEPAGSRAAASAATSATTIDRIEKSYRKLIRKARSEEVDAKERRSAFRRVNRFTSALEHAVDVAEKNSRPPSLSVPAASTAANAAAVGATTKSRQSNATISSASGKSNKGPVTLADMEIGSPPGRKRPRIDATTTTAPLNNNTTTLPPSETSKTRADNVAASSTSTAAAAAGQNTMPAAAATTTTTTTQPSNARASHQVSLPSIQTPAKNHNTSNGVSQQNGTYASLASSSAQISKDQSTVPAAPRPELSKQPWASKPSQPAAKPSDKATQQSAHQAKPVHQNGARHSESTATQTQSTVKPPPPAPEAAAAGQTTQNSAPQSTNDSQPSLPKRPQNGTLTTSELLQKTSSLQASLANNPVVAPKTTAPRPNQPPPPPPRPPPPPPGPPPPYSRHPPSHIQVQGRPPPRPLHSNAVGEGRGYAIAPLPHEDRRTSSGSTESSIHRAPLQNQSTQNRREASSTQNHQDTQNRNTSNTPHERNSADPKNNASSSTSLDGPSSLRTSVTKKKSIVPHLSSGSVGSAHPTNSPTFPTDATKTKTPTQDDLRYFLRQSLVRCPPHLKSHVQELITRGTIPRTKEKMMNHATRALRISQEAAAELWNFVDSITTRAFNATQTNSSASAGTRRDREQNNVGVSPKPSSKSTFTSQGQTNCVAKSATGGNSQSSKTGQDTNTSNKPTAERGNSVGGNLSEALQGLNSQKPGAIDSASHRRASESAIQPVSRNDASKSRWDQRVSSTGEINRATPGLSSDLSLAHQRTNEDFRILQRTKDLVSSLTYKPLETAETKTVCIKLQEDIVTVPFSNSANRSRQRGAMTVTFANKLVNKKEFEEIAVRLWKWEPFWEVVAIVKPFQSGKVSSCDGDEVCARTAFSAKFKLEDAHFYDRKVVGSIDIKPDEWGKMKAEDYAEGETRCLLFTIPKKPAKRKSDDHRWPKGTFLQLTAQSDNSNEGKRIRLDQRKQEAHDKSSWKGTSRVLDLTEVIQNHKQMFKIEGITHDTEEYYGVIVYAQYRRDKTLFDILMNPRSRDAIKNLSFADGEKKAISFASSDTLVIDSDNEDTKAEEGSKFIFSLKDAAMMKLMEHPVRGKTCKHFQCFDLSTWLAMNAKPRSGGRWRCGSCENFLSWQDLEYCGYTAHILNEFKLKASTDCDRVEVTSTGGYRLLDERKQRKRKAVPEEATSSGAAKVGKKAKINTPEVIDLL